MPDTTEEIIVRFLADTSSAIQNISNFRQLVDKLKIDLKTTAAETNASFKDTARGMETAFRSSNIGPQVNVYKTAMSQALSETRRESGETTTAFSKLGDVSRLVFGTILGITAIGALRNLISSLSDAAQSAYEFVKATFGLEIGIRAIQRAGVDITIKDMYENIDVLREKFGTFSKKELVEGSAALINLTRDFGFTKDQIFELQNAIATLAIVNGRAMDEVQRTVALAISSGYTEGLQRLGVSINRVNIAEEAGRLGYAKTYMALTEVQRSAATFNLILQKTSKYADEGTRYQENLAGAYDKTKASIVDLNVKLGETALPFKVAITQALEYILIKVNEAIDAFKKLFIIISSGFGGLAGLFAAFKADLAGAFEGMTAGEKMNMWLKAIQDGMNHMVLELSKSMGMLGGKDLLGDTAVNTEADAEKIKQTVAEALADIVDDVDKASSTLAQKEKNLTDDLMADLAKMQLQYNQRVAQANEQYNLDVLQVNQQFAQQRKELETRYRENEWKAEKDFQERMRKLREEFIFDLEDALHERDARQVLRLIRRYNLDKAQAKREYDSEKEERARQFRIEMQQLEAQREARLQTMAQEHALKLKQMAQEYQLENRMRQEQYLRDKAELEAQNEQKLKDIAESLFKQLGVTGAGMEDIRKALESVLGPGGDAEKIYNYYVAISQNAAAQAMAAMTQIIQAFAVSMSLATALSGINIQGPSGIGSTGASGYTGGATGGGSTSGTGGGGARKGKQEGGIVRKGNIEWVGEQGPEPFIPAVNGRILSVKQSQEALAQAYASSGGRGEGRINIGVRLSPDLIGEIQDNTLDAVAGVVFELERKRK